MKVVLTPHINYTGCASVRNSPFGRMKVQLALHMRTE